MWGGGIGLGLVMLSQGGAGESGGPGDPTAGVAVCAASITGGIVLLVASAENKRKATSVGINFKLQNNSIAALKNSFSTFYPALNFAIKF